MMPKKIWSFWAPRYERLWAQHFALKPARDMVIEHLERVIGSHPCRILDVGCGVGQLAEELAGHCSDWRVLGADTSPEMIDSAIARHARPNVSFLNGSIDDASRRGPFGVIVATNAFPYFPDKPVALRRLHAMLVSGGRLILVHATIENPYDLLFMLFVRLTVSRGEYWSTRRLGSRLREAGFRPGIVRPMRRAFFIPSLYLAEGIRP